MKRYVVYCIYNGDDHVELVNATCWKQALQKHSFWRHRLKILHHQAKALTPEKLVKLQQQYGFEIAAFEV